jgi:hypothetical protein
MALYFVGGKSEFKASPDRRKEKRKFQSKKVALPTRMLLQLRPRNQERSEASRDETSNARWTGVTSAIN